MPADPESPEEFEPLFVPEPLEPDEEPELPEEVLEGAPDELPCEPDGATVDAPEDDGADPVAPAAEELVESPGKSDKGASWAEGAPTTPDKETLPASSPGSVPSPIASFPSGAPCG